MNRTGDRYVRCLSAAVYSPTSKKHILCLQCRVRITPMSCVTCGGHYAICTPGGRDDASPTFKYRYTVLSVQDSDIPLSGPRLCRCL